MLAHVGDLATDTVGQVSNRELPCGERLQHTQALGVGQSPGNRRASLPHSLEIVDLEHEGNVQQLAQRRKYLPKRNGAALPGSACRVP